MKLIAQEKKDPELSFLRDVYNTYNTAHSYEMEVEVAMFNNKETLAYPKQKNYTLKSYDNFYIQTPELTTIQTTNYQLVIDHISKEVRYVSFNKEEQKHLQTEHIKSTLPDFSEMKDMIASIKRDTQITTIAFKENPTFKKTVYTFNTDSKLLKTVDYYSVSQEYGQPAHIKIEYLTSNFNQNIDDSIFRLNKYLIEIDSKLRLTTPYEGYSLVNNHTAQ
ncbi:hypothetical protein [Marixanthomonas ophiurae]|uniref:DUF4292 domain-containing protein n=1 Tax=Marixanthomonas ophiurae TaxID=387659 RepID=A0A3E1Q9K0_9FLAO|nr:hypothetical protein [Marixanthomonas ophiurae]RFN58802.1 hypothetical protein DZ858_01600 [Marixanthomonas ophiurae]